jgi:hypothetical protein
LDELSFSEADLDCTASFGDLVESSAAIINEMSQSVDYLQLTKAHYEVSPYEVHKLYGVCPDT